MMVLSLSKEAGPYSEPSTYFPAINVTSAASIFSDLTLSTVNSWQLSLKADPSYLNFESVVQPCKIGCSLRRKEPRNLIVILKREEHLFKGLISSAFSAQNKSKDCTLGYLECTDVHHSTMQNGCPTDMTSMNFACTVKYRWRLTLIGARWQLG